MPRTHRPRCAAGVAPSVAAAAACLAAASVAPEARAQAAADTAAHGGHGTGAPPRRTGHARGGVGAQAVAMLTRAAPALEGRTLVEGYLTQPVVMAHAAAAGGRLRVAATLNLEGLTLRRGQLNAGAYGEGYVDRRHPHTLVHEAVASFVAPVPGAPAVRASLSAGKGFVAFGTDDPMTRPFALFPVNHHLAQALERAVVIAGVRADLAGGRGAVALEATAFNGDEPEGPWTWPRLGRFGDSWALRATVLPPVGARSLGAGPPLELSGSVARLESPENPRGGGLDQRKASLAARWARGAADDSADAEYALVEWARTDEVSGARRAFRYQSVLAEASVRRRGVELAARAERTGRPEEERLFDAFRTVRPHLEQNVLGVTEWRIVSVAASARLPLGGAVGRVARVAPFVEVARQAPRQLVRPSAFEPPLFYGSRVLWTVSAGLRLGAGRGHARMGRYGVVGVEH